MKKLIGLLVLFVLITRLGAQVNIQTGSATYSLPVFNWNDHKSRLNTVVALNYNSGNGLRTNDVASNVGQGWNMIAGGSITRMQVGEPDDQYPREGGVSDLTKYPAGYLYNTNVNVGKGCPNALTKYPIFKDRNRLYKKNNSVEADRELDYFSFQFNGRTGLFVLDKNTNQGVCLGDSRIKISFSLTSNMSYSGKGIRTTISSFTIQDEDGLIYRFATLSLSTVLKSRFCDPGLIQPLDQPSFEGGGVYHEAGFSDNSIVNPYVVDGWYLSQIEDALTHRVVTFTYTTVNTDALAGVDVAYYLPKSYGIFTHNFSKTVTPVISSIAMPDGHNISFNYSSKERFDMKGSYALASIDVSYQSRYVSKFQLNTTYFILKRYGTPSNENEERAARLCLQSVVQFGVDLKSFNEPYVFDYYMGSNADDDFVPPPFSVNKDVWGFYNGSLSQGADGTSISPMTPLSAMGVNEIAGLCFLRNPTGNTVTLNPKTGYAKNGLLKQVNLPTGGSLSYEYEQNSAMLSSQYREVGGVHVLKTKLIDGGYSNDCTHPLVTTYSYNSEGSSQSSLWGIEAPVNMISSSSFYEPESKHYVWKPFLGVCEFRYQYPGIQSRDQAINLTSGEQLLMVFSDVMSAVSTVMTILDILHVISYNTGWGAVVLDLIFEVFALIKSCSTNPSENSSNIVYYNSDLNGINPLPAQFSRVVVTQGDGSNGNTAFTFTNPYSGTNQYALWDATNALLSKKQRFAFWAYGLPEKTTVYNAAGNKMKETENVYSFANAKRSLAAVVGQLAYPSCKCFVAKNSSQRDDNWQNPALGTGDYTTDDYSNPDLKAEIYDVFSGRVELTDNYERIYGVADPTGYTETKKHFGYNALNLQVNHIETTQSNDTKNLTDITFSCDYSTGVLSSLNSANIISVPVKKVGSIIKAGHAVRYILRETVTEYATLSNGDIKPSRILENRTNEPIEESSWASYAGPGSSLSSDFKETTKFTYDATGNLIGITDEGSRVVTNIYDYNDKYATAVIVNAEAQVYPSSYTSFETGQLGGWMLSGSASYNNNAVTGSQAFSLSGSNSLSAYVNVNKRYRLSFWASSGSSISVGSLLVLVKSAPTINGFTYYEYEVPEDGTATVTVSGSGTIDELRLYPVTARMRTVTYDPIIGKTSECDENNRITYYEYDELGRLRFIKDDYRNIVKMYEYNSKKGGCSNSYANLLMTVVFTKNDCPAGYMGSNVAYTVAAGKYTSTISQYDADLQVQNELDSYGQSYANIHGSCIPIYYNVAMSQDFDPETCPIGSKPAGAVTYSVAAGKYSSTVSQAAANQFATIEIQANGQAYANQHPNCITDYDPYWEADDPAQIMCGSGSLLGHKLVLMKDMNPNSSSYNTTQWMDAGEDHATCPIPVCTNCTGTQKKCINGVCETGLIVYTGSTNIDGQNYCVYHYEWSDGSWSTNYYQLSGGSGGEFSCLDGGG